MSQFEYQKNLHRSLDGKCQVTVFISDELDNKILKLSKLNGLSKSEIIRASLTFYFYVLDMCPKMLIDTIFDSKN